MPRQEDILIGLGARIRAIRQERRIKLKGLAEETALSIGFLSRLERGQISSSVANLIQIARALGVAVADLFDHPSTPLRSRATAHKIQHPLADPDVICTGYCWRLLAGGMPNDAQHVFHLAFPRTASLRMLVSYQGQEYCYALSGKIRFVVGAKSFDLGPGAVSPANSEVPRHTENTGLHEAGVPSWLGLP